MTLKRVGLIALSLLTLISLSSCQRARTEYSDSFFGAFDTIISVTAYANSQKEFDQFKKKVEEKSLKYSHLYDKYTEYKDINNIKTINQNAGKTPVKVDKNIIKLLEYAKDKNEEYKGQVNITFGSVLDIWHNYRKNALEKSKIDLPSQEELQKANLHTDIKKLKIDKEKSTVYLEDEKMSLDLGAIAKGYAVEQIADELQQEGYNNFLINAGGNVKAVGSPERKNGKWGIGIQNPAAIKGQSEENLLEILYANNISVVTSGIYQRYYTVQGKDYHHIIDPQTLYPANYYQSVSIICEDSALCDYLSTNIFLTKPEKAVKIIESIENVDAIFVLQNGEIIKTSGVQKYLEE